MSTENLIFELIGVNDDASAIVVKNIFTERDNLVGQLQQTDPSAQNFIEIATPLVSSAKQLLKSVEAARVKIKEPILRVSREIDTKARDFSNVLQFEVDKSERVIGEIVRRQKDAQEKIEREARERQAEALRVEQEKIAALEAKRALATSDFAIGKINHDINKALDRSTDVILQAQQEVQLAVSPILSGGSQVRSKYSVTVTDVDAAFKARPEIFKVELSKSKFDSWARLNEKNGSLPSIPGLLIVRETKASIR